MLDFNNYLANYKNKKGYHIYINLGHEANGKMRVVLEIKREPFDEVDIVRGLMLKEYKTILDFKKENNLMDCRNLTIWRE